MTPQRNLWVTNRLEWRGEARFAQAANPMPDSEASAFVFVASCLFQLPFKLVCSPVNATASATRRDRRATS